MRARRLLPVLALVASVLAVGGGGDRIVAQSEKQACDNPTRRVTMYAEQMEPAVGTPIGIGTKVRIGWGLTPESASIPGPLMEMWEGECMAITVVNDVPLATFESLRQIYGGPTEMGVSLHVHGVKYTQDSDGTVHTGSFVPPGRTRTYKWYAAPRVAVAQRVVSIGTAGYWWYHDHIVGTDHGTGGLESGLFGGLVVRRAGDLKPDKTFVQAFAPGQSINLRSYPATDTCDTDPTPSNTCLLATNGQRIEFLAFNVGNEFHTFHLHGHNWADNRTGIPQNQLDDTRVVDVKTFGPSDSFGFQIIAGESVGAGSWMLHCHVQNHSDLGMVTFFHTVEPGGPLPSAPAMANHIH